MLIPRNVLPSPPPHLLPVSPCPCPVWEFSLQLELTLQQTGRVCARPRSQELLLQEQGKNLRAWMRWGGGMQPEERPGEPSGRGGASLEEEGLLPCLGSQPHRPGTQPSSSGWGRRKNRVFDRRLLKMQVRTRALKCPVHLCGGLWLPLGRTPWE